MEKDSEVMVGFGGKSASYLLGAQLGGVALNLQTSVGTRLWKPLNFDSSGMTKVRKHSEEVYLMDFK